MEEKNLPFLPFDPKEAIQLIGRGPSRCVRDPRIKAWWISTAVFNPETDILEYDLVWNVHKDSLQEVWFKALSRKQKVLQRQSSFSFWGNTSTIDLMLDALTRQPYSVWVLNGIDFEDEIEDRTKQAQSFWLHLGAAWATWFFNNSLAYEAPRIFFLRENKYQALDFGTYPPKEEEETYKKEGS